MALKSRFSVSTPFSTKIEDSLADSSDTGCILVPQLNCDVNSLFEDIRIGPMNI